MKYYHLIGFSIMLTVLQFVLQSVFYWEVPLIIQKIFLGLQSTLLVGYSLLFLIFLVKKAKTKAKGKTKCSTNQRAPQRSVFVFES
ncbi:hypothetical protein GCM10025857_52520 [Alicyclobacillus contaminans]|nr:hypothetical protein GCM10025857_52520 [Alicyclobacillus contaminans]